MGNAAIRAVEEVFDRLHTAANKEIDFFTDQLDQLDELEEKELELAKNRHHQECSLIRTLFAGARKSIQTARTSHIWITKIADDSNEPGEFPTNPIDLPSEPVDFGSESAATETDPVKPASDGTE